MPGFARPLCAKRFLFTSDVLSVAFIYFLSLSVFASTKSEPTVPLDRPINIVPPEGWLALPAGAPHRLFWLNPAPPTPPDTTQTRHSIFSLQIYPQTQLSIQTLKSALELAKIPHSLATTLGLEDGWQIFSHQKFDIHDFSCHELRIAAAARQSVIHQTWCFQNTQKDRDGSSLIALVAHAEGTNRLSAALKTDLLSQIATEHRRKNGNTN